jgi:hypothetical protein
MQLLKKTRLGKCLIVPHTSYGYALAHYFITTEPNNQEVTIGISGNTQWHAAIREYKVHENPGFKPLNPVISGVGKNLRLSIP